MRILLIAATKSEIEPFIVENKGIEVLITGVGVPATLYQLQKTLQHKTTDLVIQAGIGGCFTDEADLGKVVLVKQDTFADIGMEENEKFTTLFESGYANKDAFPFKDGWLVNSNIILKGSNLPAVKAITINKVSDRLIQRQQAINIFSPQIESMEGAAMHYVCLQEHIPFVQIRSISNLVGERDKSKWMLKESLINLHRELDKLIAELLR